MQVQHMELLSLGAPPEMLPLPTAAEEAAADCAESPTDLATTGLTGLCCRSKGGPRGSIGRNGAAVCRVPCGRASTRDAFWTVLLLLLSSYPILCMSVCLVLPLRAFQIPENLSDYLPRYRVRSGRLFSRRPEAVWFPIKARSARHGSGSVCTASNSLEGWQLGLEPTSLCKRSTRPRRRFSAWLHGCVAACAARAAVQSANEKIQPAKR